MKSILQNKKECFITKVTHNLDVHHVMNGPFRNKSEQYGLTIYLEHYVHMDIHRNPIKMRELKAFAQEKFEKIYSRELWMKEFKKNYL